MTASAVTMSSNTMLEHRNAFLCALALYFYTLNSIGLGLKVLTWMTIWYLTGGKYWFYLFRHTIIRDLRLLFKGLRVLGYLTYFKLSDMNSVRRFRRIVRKVPNNIMYVNGTTDAKFTFKEVEDMSNRIANYFLSKGFRKGDTVALYMTNRPEYIITWLGLAKIGVVPALVNFNLRKDPLVHTITVVKCKAVIYGLELESAIKEIKDDLKKSLGEGFVFFSSKRGSELSESSTATIPGCIDLDAECEKSSSMPEPKNIRKSIHHNDSLFYIYTSGTTGLPKAVDIRHIRQLFTGISIVGTLDITPADIIYSYLPLYHSSGVQLGCGTGLVCGNKTIIKPKFSASNFFSDCVKYEATVSQYIGEIARYLLATKPSPSDRAHKLRIMYGNGLKAQIWEKFTERFKIPNIGEFYGSTEGNCNLINIENIVGCCGFLGVIWPEWIKLLLLPLFLVKVDENGEPVRNRDGFCIKAAPGEPGEFVGKIVPGDPVKDFHGYKDKTATDKKTLSNVFKRGDLYFRSGDIMVADEFGNLTFKDRQGDTYRWQGENVSTNEVEAIISSILELKDATSYGVEIPNTDGRAGMVAIPVQKENEIDFDRLYNGITEKLPKYARPLFVRLIREVQMTSTFKLQKTKLQQEGFDPVKVKDPLFFNDPKAGTFVRIDEGLHKSIIGGEIRL